VAKNEQEEQLKRIVVLICLCCLVFSLVGCSGSGSKSKTGKMYMGKDVTLSLKGGEEQLRGKVLDIKVNEYITLESELYVFTVNLQNRLYRIVMEKELK
jgi:formate-dependent phosphoribosylglycinamide formyltransferase (GAR transformylase)